LGWVFLLTLPALAACGGEGGTVDDVVDNGPADQAGETDNGPETDAGPDAAPDGDSDVVPDGDPDVVPDGDPDVVPDGDPDVVPDGDPDVAPDGDPEAEADGVPDGVSEAEADGTPDGVPETEADAGDATAETSDGVACGPTLVCRPPADRCCVQDVGTTPSYSCIGPTDTCPSGIDASCDGPEDCSGVCCLTVTFGTGGTIDSATAECATRAACSSPLSQAVVCRSAAADCVPATSMCCPAPSGFGITAGYCWSLTTTCPF
jgi:hypothetical protein